MKSYYDCWVFREKTEQHRLVVVVYLSMQVNCGEQVSFFIHESLSKNYGV